MNCIKVSVGPVIRGAELHPVYDPDANILAVTSGLSREWPHGIDIDGNIVFDIDAARVLANFDVHVPKRRWKKGPAQLWPEAALPGVIKFSDDAIGQKSFNLPLGLLYDQQRAVLRVDFGTGECTQMVALSKECIALLSGHHLTGFLIKGI